MRPPRHAASPIVFFSFDGRLPAYDGGPDTLPPIKLMIRANKGKEEQTRGYLGAIEWYDAG